MSLSKLTRIFRPSPELKELLKPSKHKYYEQIPMPPRGWPERETPEALRKSLDKCHDIQHAVLRENDRLRKVVLDLYEAQRWLLKLFIALMLGTWTVMGGVLKWLIPYAIRGMAK